MRRRRTARCKRTCSSRCRSRADEDAEVAHQGPVDAESVRLDQLKMLGRPVDHRVVREDDRDVCRRGQQVSERAERPTVEALDRFASRRGGPPVGRIRRDPVNAPRSEWKMSRIRHRESILGLHIPQGVAASEDPPPAAIEPDRTESNGRRLEEDAPGAAEGIQDRAGHRHPREVHERARELRVEGDREGERPMGDLRRLEARAVHPVDHPAQEELLADEEAVVDGRLIEVHPARAAEIGPEGTFHRERIDVDAQASRSDAEGPAVEVGVLCERPDSLEIAGGEFLGYEVGQAEPMGRPFDRSDRIDPKDLVIERGRPDLDPLGCEGRQGLGPREGRMLSGQFDERPHVRPTVAPRMSLPTTGILKSNGPFGRAVRIRPFVPNDIPAVASIVREALRENYPTSLYLDIHRWWRDGFLIADLDGHPVGFLAAVISSDGQARILMFAVSAGCRRRGFGRQVMDAFVPRCAIRGIRQIELEVRISNDEAIAFYKRYGFEIAGVLEKFYTDGEDGYKMFKRL